MRDIIKTVQRGADLLGRAGRGKLVRGHNIIGHVDGYRMNRLHGWAMDLRNPALPLEISVRVLGREIACTTAKSHRADLLEAGYENAAHGYDFYVDLSAAAQAADIRIEARDPASGKYKKLQINPDVNNALRLELDKDRRSTQSLRDNKNLILMDVQDLLAFLHGHNGVTGIQRVVGGMIQAILRNQIAAANTVFCQIGISQGHVDVFNASDLLELVSMAMNGNALQVTLREKIAAIRSQADDYELKKGDVFFIAGAYWVVPDFAPRLNALKERGVIIGTYIYDLIPITAPEWVTDDTRVAVTDRAIDILFMSDFFLTISEFVASEVRTLLEIELGQRKPVVAVSLPHALPPRKRLELPVRDSIASLRPFVLAVGTLEGRKNHMLLYRIWATLIRRYGAAKMPLLVLVGRWGWNIDRFRESIEATNALGGQIRIFTDVGDHELSYLYEHCLFTTFASFVEGWGLPVGEALTLNKLCLCSNTTSVPEVGGDFCEYFSPYDYLSAFKLFEETIINGEALRQKQSRIAREFKPKGWDEFVAELLSCIRDTGAGSGRLIPLLEPFVLRDITSPALVTNQTLSWTEKAFKFARVSGWHELEPWGVWATFARAELKFRTPFLEKPIVVMCELRTPPTVGVNSIKVTGSAQSDILVSDTPGWVYFRAYTCEDGIVTIVFDCDYQPLAEPTRNIFFGISSIVYCDILPEEMILIPTRLLEAAKLFGDKDARGDKARAEDTGNVF